MIVGAGCGVAGSAPGWYETFSSPGPLGDGWVDAVDVWGADQFDRAVVEEGVGCTLDAHTADVWYEQEYGEPSPWVVGHAVCARDMGATDGEVSLRWDVSAEGYEFGSQVAPAFGMDLEAADPLQMGVAHVWDVGFGQHTYSQNVFRSASLADVLDPPPYYRPIDGTRSTDPGGAGTLADGWIAPGAGNWISLRVVDGEFCAYWNGQRRHPPVPVPEWAEGRTWWGFHVVSISPVSGAPHPYIPSVFIDRHVNARWGAWCWRPFAGPL